MTQDRAASPFCVILGDGPVKLYGLTGKERLLRQLRRAGVTDERIVPPSELSRTTADSVAIFRADRVFEEPLVGALLEAREVALLDDGGQVAAVHVPAAEAEAVIAALESGGELPARLSRKTPKELAGTYNKQLRKRAEFYVLAVSEEARYRCEKRVFAGTYKGVTDVVSKYVFPFPVFHLTRLAAALRMHPNTVTTISLLFTLATIFLWLEGHLWAGLATAWTMLILDTVDGKLARTTLTSSKFGDIFDHGIDLIHPPFWYWAWIEGLMPNFPYPREVLSVLVVVYVVQRLQEGYFIKRFGIEMHVWRRFDSFFREITARRDPNIAVLTIFLLFGQPALGLVVVTAWAVISLGVHTVQILQAEVARARGQAITSWLAAPG